MAELLSLTGKESHSPFRTGFFNWHALTPLDETSQVELKGFLYKTESGKWVLAKNPNLKHCCIGKIERDKEQVFLDQEFDYAPLSRVVTLKGILESSPNGYILKDAILTERKEGIPFTSVTLFFTMALLLFVFFKKRKKP